MLLVFFQILLFSAILISLIFIPQCFSKKIVFPIVFSLLSVGLFFMSFIIGKWSGIQLGMLSVSLFVSSVISFLFIMIFHRRALE